MDTIELKPRGFDAEAKVRLAERPRVIPAADANQVMREQLDYLIEHAQAGACGCPECQRYLCARKLLLKPFVDDMQGLWRAAA
jgi:hypothetical protein